MEKKVLKLLISGSVDDGKSTLLGRLLYETKSVFKDQLNSAKEESKKYGTQGSNTDLALLVDGLQDEREQGITIDVAYRYFQTKYKKYIIADTPGHKQYTRNMATGASNSELALIIIDATKGITEQTRLHAFIISLFRLEKIIILINKMDLIGFNKKKYEKIKKEFVLYLDKINFDNFEFIPVSALTGDNVVKKSKKNKWYKGRSLLNSLDATVVKKKEFSNFRMPVQWVNRNSSFRGYSGIITSGFLSKGDKVIVSPSNKVTKIKKIFLSGKNSQTAQKNQSVTLQLSDHIDVVRGDCVSSFVNPIKSYNSINAKIFWIDKSILVLKKKYKIQFTASNTDAEIIFISYKYNLKDFTKVNTKTLNENEIGFCKISLNKKIPLEKFSSNKKMGTFILIDKITNSTVGTGIIDDLNETNENIFWQATKVNKEIRAKTNLQKPCLLWFTGLSASGKSTIANLVEKKLFELNKKTYLLDGDNLRHGLNSDLTFTDIDRKENIRRVTEVSKLMMDAGLIVLTSFISPFRSDRFLARKSVGSEEFVEIFVDAPLAVCEKRDPKGLYKKARLGKLKNFTGISSKYEKPNNPNLILKSAKFNAKQLADKVFIYLKKKRII